MNVLKPLAIAATSVAMLAQAKADDVPLPSVRGMYCSSPCIGSYAPDQHLGELATLLIYRQQCQQPMVSDAQLMAVWQEWRAAPQDARDRAVKHEIAAIDARRHKYGEEYGGWTWFCKLMTDRITKDAYQDLIESAANRAYRGEFGGCKHLMNGNCK